MQNSSGTSLLKNEWVHFAPGTCPACSREVSLVASPGERVARWICAHCKTVGMAPWVPMDKLETEGNDAVTSFASA